MALYEPSSYNNKQLLWLVNIIVIIILSQADDLRYTIS